MPHVSTCVCVHATERDRRRRPRRRKQGKCAEEIQIKKGKDYVKQ